MKMNYVLFCLSLMIIITSCSTEEAIENPIQSQKIDLRGSIDFCMTTYNIQAFCNGILPPDDIPGSPEYYGQQICASITELNSDYVNLQEVWCEEVAESIEECLRSAGYNGFVYDQSSGLMSISQTASTTQQVIPFTGPEGGADHLVDKGFIHTSFEIMQGCTVNIINTHTQADNPWYEDVADEIFARTPFGFFFRHSTISEDVIRRIQLEQIKRYMGDNIDNSQIAIIGGDFNIKKLDDNGDISTEFADLISLVQGQPSHLITNVPTNNGGDILDYFIISNYDQFANNIETITTSVYNCIDEQKVKRYNVYQIDNYEFPTQRYIISTFDSLEEAQEYKNQVRQEDIENGDYYYTYDIESEDVTICKVNNNSDHKIVETCIENYECC